MKAELASLMRACAKIVNDVTWIRIVISGLFKMVAKKSERRNETKERARPKMISKISPVAKMFFIWFGLFS